MVRMERGKNEFLSLKGFFVICFFFTMRFLWFFFSPSRYALLIMRRERAAMRGETSARAQNISKQQTWKLFILRMFHSFFFFCVFGWIWLVWWVKRDSFFVWLQIYAICVYMKTFYTAKKTTKNSFDISLHWLVFSYSRRLSVENSISIMSVIWVTNFFLFCVCLCVCQCDD